MNRLTLQVFKYCKREGLLKDGMKIVAGVSGGADSVCLLKMLKEMTEQLGLDIFCVHIEHGIRGEESRQDCEFVRRLCAELAVPLKVYEEDVPTLAARMDMTVEEAGRFIRYRAFEEVRREEGADAIAVAHHLNDQAETVLFNMARGSGIKGMSGMSPRNDMIIRPLLGITRRQIEEYLSETGQEYCIDSTNTDLKYSRNGIRGVVIPELERIVTKASEHIARAAKELGEADDYLRAEAARICDREVTGGIEGGYKLGIAVLTDRAPIIQRYVVRDILTKIYSGHKDLEYLHVNDVLSLCDKQSGRSISLPRGITARREGDHIYIGRPEASQILPAGPVELNLDGDTIVSDDITICSRVEDYNMEETIPNDLYTKWFDYDKIESTVLVRTRCDGDYLTIGDTENRKKLKKYLIDEKVPSSLRDQVILLADGAHIIWVVGKRISSHYKIGAETRRVLRIDIKIR